MKNLELLLSEFSHSFPRRAVDTMPATRGDTRDAVKSAVAGVWLLFSVCSAVVRAQEGKENFYLLTFL